MNIMLQSAYLVINLITFSAAVRSKAVVLLLFIHCLLLPPWFCGDCEFWSLLCYAVLSVVTSFAIILLGRRELFDLL